MFNSISNRKLAFVLALGIILVGCGPYLNQPLQVSRARLGPETPVQKELQSIPAPSQQIVAAVYKFRDQTGQYKPSETGANWSTAITQGATTILLRVLEESGWFIPIERENVNNLLNERKIIRSSRSQYDGTEEDQLLPPLLFAGIILEGGIISYETNVTTGGAGLRYFGAGGSGSYREDRVTIYLRAVSTSNGKILKTVYTTKSILSQEVSAGIFRYVKLQRLLEAETGYTYNEPTEMAVTEALEKAVVSLVYEGIEDNLWSFENPDDIDSRAYRSYLEEREDNLSIDHNGVVADNKQRGKVRIGVSANLNNFQGDYKAGNSKFGFSVSSGVSMFSNRTYADLDLSYSELDWVLPVNRQFLSADFNLTHLFLPEQKFTPLISVGAGISANYTDGVIDVGNRLFPKINTAIGFDYMLNKRVSVDTKLFYNYHLNDNFDKAKSGDYNDAIWGVKVGINYYINISGKNKPYYYF